MGKSIAFRYSVQLILAPGSGYAMTPSGWRERKQGQIPGDGKPTNANLKKYVDSYNASLAPGKPNAHLGESSKAVGAYIVDHHAGKTIALYGSGVTIQSRYPLAANVS